MKIYLKKYINYLKDLMDKTADEVIDYIYDQVIKEYEEKLEDIPEEIRDEFEKAISLRVIDNYWMEHINTMSHLREGIAFKRICSRQIHSSIYNGRI